MRTIDEIEISIEETETEIKRVTEFLEFTLSSRIDSSIKAEFSKRLNSELEWLYNIKEEEQEALSYQENSLEMAIQEDIEKRHANKNNGLV